MKNTFTPFEGIDNVTFGMTRNDVRASLGDNYIEFRRGYAENTTDFYSELGMFIEYDEGNICNAVECTPDSNLFYLDEDLLKFSFSNLRRKFDVTSDNKEEENGKGITYHDLGFGVSKSNNTDKIETVIIFSRNYW